MASSSGATSAAKGDRESASYFECNICLEVADEPVTTPCGHLYCWPCLYKWMNLHSDCPQCPVCKSAIDKEKVIPLYGRGKTRREPRKFTTSTSDSIPSRPAGQRTEAPTQHHQQHQHATGHAGQTPFNIHATPAGPFATAQFGFSFSAGLGLFPFLFGLSSFTYPSYNPQHPNQGGAPNADQEQQVLRRVLIVLLTFVVLCLLLF
mmetsp:Transcript_18179/g.29869  ORF Transcript_18179/g.29869 Transcript_18179/m.29869 type:complete len:206 (+) Transcript_18179:41-658(+)